MQVTEETDIALRSAALTHVQRLSAIHNPLTAEHLKAGFTFRGERVPLINPQRGIFKPQVMRSLLSIRTVYPRSGAKVWYDDQRQVHEQIYSGQESVDYAFMGTDPNAAENRWLREAAERQTPVIYFLGVAPGRYQAIAPAYISSWDAGALKAEVVFAEANRFDAQPPADAGERRYGLRLVKQRLHQAQFREAVIAAYDGRCSLSRLPESRLLDAAHIMADADERFGQPVVPNGLPLSKIHHAAFDAHLIGIDADYKLHVSGQLLEQNDGPVLEALKSLDGQVIHLPKRARDWPDRERLAARFEIYSSVA